MALCIYSGALWKQPKMFGDVSDCVVSEESGKATVGEQAACHRS